MNVSRVAGGFQSVILTVAREMLQSLDAVFNIKTGSVSNSNYFISRVFNSA